MRISFSYLLIKPIHFQWIVVEFSKPGKNRSRYFENFFLSFSFFLSWLPTVNETFTRIPTGNPLAKSPGDPIIGKTLLVIFLLFIVGSIYQFRQQKKDNALN